MKTITDNLSKAELTGNIESQDLQIEANSKAFKELINGIYADKAYAIARETIANGFDSHVEAGTPERPLLIHLPTAFEPHYSIRDYGVSMDHNTVMTLYRTLFRSTKDDPNSAASNNYVGKFGLGSKSPFAYTDAFQVTTFIDGEKRYYDVFFNEGTPRIGFLGSEETDEDNGVLVSFGVDPKDCQDFERAVKRAVEGLDVTPIFEGKEPTLYNRTVLDEGDGWRLLDGTQSGDAEARQGTVLYPLNFEAIIDCPLSYRGLLKKPFQFDFNIGELDVVTSREALSYDKRTSDNIIKRLEEVAEEIKERIANSVKSAETYWEFCNAYYKAIAPYEDRSFEFIKGSKPKFMGRAPRRVIHVNTSNVHYEVEAKNAEGEDVKVKKVAFRFGRLSFCKLTAYDMRNKSQYTFRPDRGAASNTISLDTDKKLIVVLEDIRDKNRYSSHRMKKIIDTIDYSERLDYQILWLRQSADSDFALRRLFVTLGRPDMQFIRLMDIEYEAPKRQYATGPRPKFKILNDKGDWVTPTEGALPPKKAVYVPMRGGMTEGDHEFSTSRMSAIRAALVKLGEEKLPILGIPASHRNQIKNNPDWKTFQEYAFEKMEKHFDQDMFNHLYTRKYMPAPSDLLDLLKELGNQTGEKAILAALEGTHIQEYFTLTEANRKLLDEDEASVYRSFKTFVEAYTSWGRSMESAARVENSRIRSEWNERVEEAQQNGEEIPEEPEYIKEENVGRLMQQAAEDHRDNEFHKENDLSALILSQFSLLELLSSRQLHYANDPHRAAMEVLNYIEGRKNQIVDTAQAA